MAAFPSGKLSKGEELRMKICLWQFFPVGSFQKGEELKWNFACDNLPEAAFAPGKLAAGKSIVLNLGTKQKTRSRDSLNRSQYKMTALLNTTPWPRSQVVCKWFSAPTLNQSDLALASVAEFTTTPRPYIGHKLSCCHEIEMPPDTGKQEIFALTRRDSNLEAFSYNLSNGSFGPLVCRLSPWTKCLNPLFLSY